MNLKPKKSRLRWPQSDMGSMHVKRSPDLQQCIWCGDPTLWEFRFEGKSAPACCPIHMRKAVEANLTPQQAPRVA